MRTKTLYIASLEKNSGSLVVAIGFMHDLKAKYQSVAFYRPIISDENKKDNDIKTISKLYDLQQSYEKSFGFYSHEIENLIAQNKHDKIYKKILTDITSLQKEYDFILIEGISKDFLSTTIDFDINLSIAKNISSPIMAVLNGNNKEITQIEEEILIEEKTLQKSHVSHFATFVNRIDESKIKHLNQRSQNNKKNYLLYFLPEKKEIDTLTVGQVKKVLDAKVLFGDKSLMQKHIEHKRIGAMRAEHFIDYISQNDLIITPADRADIILSLSAMYYSKKHPNIAGVVLSGDNDLNDNVLKLLCGYDDFAMPILKTQEDTYSVIKKIESIKAIISHNDSIKIATILGIFAKYVSFEPISLKLANNDCDITTPIMFKHMLLQKARLDKKTIVLPESLDERVLKAAVIIKQNESANIILIGPTESIRNKALNYGVNIDGIKIIDPNTSKLSEVFANEFVRLRQHKHVEFDEALDLILNDVSYFGTMMVQMGYADGMVSGAVNTTANTVRPALQIIKTKATSDVVSSLFFMALDTQVLVYADCAINTNPSANELATIAIDSSDNAKAFGIEPKIAMLSYSTCDSGSGCDVEKVKVATNIVKELRPDIQIEGPIQYDAAIDKQVAKKKLPNSCVAGNATVFIFPDLNTGNNTYKAVRDSSGADAIGPILQGLNKPINDLSRGCNVEDIVNTIIITAVQGSMQ